MFNAARRHRLRTTLVALTMAGGTLALPAVAPPPASAAALPACGAAGMTVSGLGGPNFYIDSGATPSFRSGYTGYAVTNATGAGLDDVWAQLSDFTGGSLALATGQSAAQRVGDLDAGARESRFWYLTAATASASAQNHTVTLYRHNPALPNSTALCSTTGGFSSVQGTLAASANKVTGISVTGGTPKLGSQFTVTVTGNTGQIGAGVAGDAESLWMTPAVAENWPASAFRLVGTSLTISPDGTAAPTTYSDILRVAGLGSTARDYTASYTFRAIGFSASDTTVRPVQEIASGTQVKHTGSYSVTLPAIPPAINDLSFALSADPGSLDLGGGTVDLTGTVSGTAGAELDSLLVTLPDGASVVPGSATWGGQPVGDPVASGGDQVLSGPFVVGTGTKLGLKVHFDATPGQRRVALLGAVGTARIGSASAPTDGSNPATVDVDVDKAPAIQDKTVSTPPGEPVTVGLDGLVTETDPWVATTGEPTHGTVVVDGHRVTYTPESSEYVGDDTFTVTVDDGRGGTATATVTVHVDPEAVPQQPTAQAIDFAQPGDLVVGGSTTATASADSGLPVTVTSQTPEVCSVDGTEVLALAAGDCVLQADQPGDDLYAPAAPVVRTVTVTAPVSPPAAQSITFAPPATVLGLDALDLDAGATSELPVSYELVSGDCELSGAQLTAATAGSCVVEAGQAGDETHEAAAPVDATITFVVPTDDATTTAGNTPVTVDVTANDPEGVVLTDVTTPAHGSAAIVDGQVRYTPAAGFRGTDGLDYTVTDGDRSAEAHVLVEVDNLAPALEGLTLSQDAGTSYSTVLVPTDPNGDPVVLSALSPNAGVNASVSGNVLTLTADRAASGVVDVPVTATDSVGATATAYVRTVVRPVAPTDVKRRLDRAGTHVSWRAAPTTGASYEVLVDGAVGCATSATSCDLPTLAGPRRSVVVRTLGRDSTRSSVEAAPLSGHGSVLIATVYFRSGSAALTRHDRGTLRAAVAKIQGSGFAHARLDGYTDADGGLAFNLALSHRRTAAVAAYLKERGRIGSSQSWYGELHPVASNDAAHGKARNRRVEVLVRY
jgi:outer membrane protein OmpA-like peptidoglycan-associated protein